MTRSLFTPGDGFETTRLKTAFLLAAILLCALLLSSCGGGGSSSPPTPAPEPVVPMPDPPPMVIMPDPPPVDMMPTGVESEIFLYRDLELTLPEVLAQQADSPEDGLIREFTATNTYLILPPNAFVPGEMANWQTDTAANFESTIFLRPGVNDGHTFRISGRAGFRGTYDFTPETGLGWGAEALPTDAFVWPELFRGTYPSDVDIEHHFALAYATDGDDEPLAYAAYGWWALGPTAGGPNRRRLSGLGGMSLGLETFARDMPQNVNATWRGRATGHALDANHRWVIEGDAVLGVELNGPTGTFLGRIENTRIAPIDPDTLQPDLDLAGDWHTVLFETTSVSGAGYNGRVDVADPIRDPSLAPAGFAGPTFGTPTGRYEGAFYGPAAEETAGQWYMREAYGDASMGEMVVAGGFGARRSDPEPVDMMPDPPPVDVMPDPPPVDVMPDPPPVDVMPDPPPVDMMPTGVESQIFLYRDLELTLPEVLAQQADSPEDGLIREFTATSTYLILPPNAFVPGEMANWKTDTAANFESTVFLRPGVNDGHTFRISGRAGFRGTYDFTPETGLGWGAEALPTDAFVWPELFRGTYPSDVDIEHHFALAYATDGDDEPLKYAAYGWWALGPTAGGPNRRRLSGLGGMSLGLETFARDMPQDVNATWRGRATGHALDANHRWVIEGDAVLGVELNGPTGTFLGRIENTRIAPIDPDTLQPNLDLAGDWHTVLFETTSVSGAGYNGRVDVADPIRDPSLAPAGFTGPTFGTPTGRYEGAFYGPAAEETAGQWYMREAYGDASMGEMVVAGGFGARRSDPEPGGTTLDETATPKRLAENNYRVSRLERLGAGDVEYGYYDNMKGSRPNDMLPGGFSNPYAVILSADDSGIDYSLRLGGSYGYQGTYAFTPDDRVAGFHQDRNSPLTWQPVWQIKEVPSGANHDHDVILSVTDRAAPGGDLDYARYGWWAITPYFRGGAVQFLLLHHERGRRHRRRAADQPRRFADGFERHLQRTRHRAHRRTTLHRAQALHHGWRD